MTIFLNRGKSKHYIHDRYSMGCKDSEKSNFEHLSEEAKSIKESVKKSEITVRCQILQLGTVNLNNTVYSEDCVIMGGKPKFKGFRPIFYALKRIKNCVFLKTKINKI